MGALTNDEREKLADRVEDWCAKNCLDCHASSFDIVYVIMALEALGWTGKVPDEKA